MSLNKPAGEINDAWFCSQAGDYAGVINIKDTQVSIRTVVRLSFDAVSNICQRDAMAFAQIFFITQGVRRHVKHVTQ